MSVFEYDMEKHMKSEKEEAREEFAQMLQGLMEEGKMDELKRALSDQEYRKQLCREYAELHLQAAGIEKLLIEK